MDLSFWRDFSLALLCLEVAVLFLPLLAGLYFAWRGLRWLNGKARLSLSWVRNKVEAVRQLAEGLSRRTVGPLIYVQALAAGLRGGVSFLLLPLTQRRGKG